MKKILLTLLVLVTTLPLAAQHKATTLVGTNVWGYYNEETVNTDVVDNIGLSAKTTYVVVMKVPADGVMKGAKIQAVNLPVRSATSIDEVSVIVYDSDRATVLAQQSVDVSTLDNLAFTTVMLKDPVTVDRDLYVGCQFRVISTAETGGKFPVLVDPRQHPAESLWMYYNDQWNDNSGFGAYIMQVYATDMKLSDAVATFSGIESHTMVDSDNTFSYTINSDCGIDVESIDYAISVNGGEEEVRSTDRLFIESGYNQKGKVNITWHSPADVCTYEVRMRILRVNGIDNALADEVAVSTIANVDRTLQRNVVMEEFTGTGCGNCPRGLVGMKHCNDQYGDRFVGIAVHRYNGSDPMYLASYDDNLAFPGAPMCYLDRVRDFDPYYGDTGNDGDFVGNRITENVGEYLERWTPASVTAQAQFDEYFSRVTVEATVDALCEADYKVVYVLTADSLYNKTWNQANYCYTYTPEGYHAEGDELMAQFCNGGIYGTSNANCYFNDVAVASSYVSGSNRGGTVSMQANTQKTVSYKLNLPTKDALYKACMTSRNLMHACVLLIDKDGRIANGCKAHVAMPDAITDVEAPARPSVRKYLQSGRLVIERNGKKYNAAGY